MTTYDIGANQSELSYAYGLNHGPLLLQGVDCNGDEENLLDCDVTFLDDKGIGECFIPGDLFSLHCVDG